MNNENRNKYRWTRIGSYLSLSLQAYCACCLPILFVSLMEMYDLHYVDLGIMIFLLYTIQIVVDVIIPHFVDKFGFKPFALGAPIVLIFGCALFTLSPVIFPNNVRILFYIGISIISSAAGLLEILVSPIIEQISFDNKAKSMSILHGFYGVGVIFVTLVTSLLVIFLGEKYWQIIMSVFLVIPVVVFFIFLNAPFPSHEENKEKKNKYNYLKDKMFYVFLFAICLGAGMEVTMNQWASTFFENALGLDKAIGDVLALGMFAVTFTIGRFLFGFLGHKVNLGHVLIAGASFTSLCYLALFFSSNDILSIIACALSGIGVSMMWPGTLSQGSKYYKNPSTIYFGLMSACGDIGAAVIPLLVGVIVDNMSSDVIGLKYGMLFGCAISMTAIILEIIICVNVDKKVKIDSLK